MSAHTLEWESTGGGGGRKAKAASALQPQAKSLVLPLFRCIARTTCCTPRARTNSNSSRAGCMARSRSRRQAVAGQPSTASSGRMPTAHSTSCWQHATSVAGSRASSSIRRTTRFAAAKVLCCSIMSARPPSAQKSFKEMRPDLSLSQSNQHRSIHSRLAATAEASKEEVPQDFKTARNTSAFPISLFPGLAQCRNHPSRSCSNGGGGPFSRSIWSSSKCSASHRRRPRSAQKPFLETRPSPDGSHSLHSDPRREASSLDASTGTTAGSTFSKR
mmetsp:Transcript_69453/g.165548  ORF Transcript_69453/g.165548 Transcript_69453/m.165548 type:complete len:274 (+) Transcript_69453:1816-2637(+)